MARAVAFPWTWRAGSPRRHRSCWPEDSNPSTVAAALLDVPAIGVDVAGGVEPRPVAPGRPPKDPYRVALFIKRAKGSRLDRPTADSRPQQVDRSLVEPDTRGRWGLEGEFGGRFVPETLMAALTELEAAWAEIREQPAYLGGAARTRSPLHRQANTGVPR